MEARTRAADRSRAGASGRSSRWCCSRSSSGAFVASGSSLVGLIGANPPQPDEFDVRRVEFKPGEIRIRVTNPQQDDLTIASVTVDDAIVPFDGRRPADARTAAFEHDRDPVRLGRGRPDRRRRDELDRDRDGRGDSGRGRDAGPERQQHPRLRDHRLPRRRPARRARPALAALAAAGRPALADRLHGADRGPALVPRRRGALRGVRAPGDRSGRARRPGPRPARRRAQLPDDDVPLGAVVRAPERRSRRASRSRRSSRSGSGSTTSAKGSRSARRSPSGS